MQNNSKKWIIVMAIGIIALAAGIAVFLMDKNIADNYTGTTTAIVVDYAEEEEYSSSLDTLQTVYCPIVTYSANGSEYTEKYDQRYSDIPYAIGESVEIKYDPYIPEKFSIAEDDRGKVIVLWEVPVGIILIAVAVYQLIKQKKLQTE